MTQNLNAKEAEALRKRFRDLFAMLGSANAGEAATARAKLDALLVKHRKKWADLVNLMEKGGDADASWSDPRADQPADPNLIKIAGKGPPHALALVHHILTEYIDMKPHEAIAASLWVLHTHVFNRAPIAPRLALMSPVRGCGKTEFFRALGQLVLRPEIMDGTSAPAIYWLIDKEQPTMLIDEGDNLGMLKNQTLKAILNSGHREGGGIYRVIDGAPKKFSTFTPLAIAAIGSLPLPLTQRSIVIHMERKTCAMPKVPEHGDRKIDYVYGRILKWAATAKLADNPDIPPELKNRQADNWRVLLSIADTFGGDWPAKAREAALMFARSYHDEDAGVVLLADIRDIFNAASNPDKITTENLLGKLHERDSRWSWSEFRGQNDDQIARKLSAGELSRLLRPFEITPRSIRFPGIVKTSKGYKRTQFEGAWANYCEPPAPEPWD